jgi:glyoxylase-like metal-dependent hydrolase (beta-lactamase superfamily II)
MRFSRRDLLAASAGLLAASALPGRAAVPPFRRPLGQAELMVVSDGILNVPLSMSLPATPPAEAAALFAAHGLPADGAPAQTNVTLVKTGSDLVLIDAGSGHNFQSTAGKLGENLEAAGIDPGKVTRVVFTHAHPDHLWGVIDELDEPRFPNATYVIAAAEWDFWIDPGTVAKMPEAFQGIALASARTLKRLEDRIERRRDGETVAPGLTYVATAGHTPGHMAVLAEGGGERVLIGGDVLTHPAISFAKPDWRRGADLDHEQATATRRRLLDRLVADRLPLVGFHLPYPGFGMVERKDAAYRFVAV